MEFWVKQFPPQLQPEAKRQLTELTMIETAADPVVYFQKLQELGRFADSCQIKSKSEKMLGNSITSVYQGATTMFGYKPQGTKIWNFFPNPWGVFAYFGEQYWAVGACIDLLRQEINSDGFMLKASPESLKRSCVGTTSN